MIRLTCTQCKADLTMDDAFAGGVCRCQHCGTIQTVPKAKKDGTVAGKPATALYKSRIRPESFAGSGTGLDQLADAVASSGLTSGRLRRPAALDYQTPPPRRTRISNWVIFTSVAVVALLLGAGGMMFVGIRRPVVTPMPAPAASAVTPPDAVAPTPTVKPAFAGIPLDEPSVIFVLDHGKASADSFSYLRNAVYHSLASLPAKTKFQIIFWNNNDGAQEDLYPLEMAYATPQHLAACRYWADAIAAGGRAEVDSALKRAIEQRPAVIVLASAKGWELDDQFVKTVMDIRGKSPTRIHTLSIGSGDSPALKSIAEKTGGQYRRLSASELEAAGNP